MPTEAWGILRRVDSPKGYGSRATKNPWEDQMVKHLAHVAGENLGEENRDTRNVREVYKPQGFTWGSM
jgi:hypothetical protein